MVRSHSEVFLEKSQILQELPVLESLLVKLQACLPPGLQPY